MMASGGADRERLRQPRQIDAQNAETLEQDRHDHRPAPDAEEAPARTPVSAPAARSVHGEHGEIGQSDKPFIMEKLSARNVVWRSVRFFHATRQAQDGLQSDLAVLQVLGGFASRLAVLQVFGVIFANEGDRGVAWIQYDRSNSLRYGPNQASTPGPKQVGGSAQVIRATLRATHWRQPGPANQFYNDVKLII